MFTDEQFDGLIDEAIRSIPEPLRDAIENVLIVAADRPTPEQLRGVGLSSGHMLFGLYQGLPKTARSVFHDAVPPDRITIFRDSLIRAFGHSEDELVRQIWITVVHEIGHHFGLSEEDMAHLEADARVQPRPPSPSDT